MRDLRLKNIQAFVMVVCRINRLVVLASVCQHRNICINHNFMNKQTKYKNEVIKRKYFDYLKGADGFDDKTIDAIDGAVLLWQDFSNESDFRNFNKRKVLDFKVWLKEKKKLNGKGVLSVKYRYHILRRLRGFFEWLSKQEKYKSKINVTFIDFLKLSRKENRIAVETSVRPKPTLEEVKRVVCGIESQSEVGRRDRALFALVIITGARVSAVTSLPIQSFDRAGLTLYQDPNFGVKTKFNKMIVTKLVPFCGDEFVKIFLDWFDYLVQEKKFVLTDPIFPATKIAHGEGSANFCSSGEVEKDFWKESGSVRRMFEKRFKEANIRYYHPHTFRHLIVAEAMKMPLTEEQKKAFSQNMGHEHVGTTFGSYGYGKIDMKRQLELVESIDFEGKKKLNSDLTDEEILKIIRKGRK